MEISNNVKVASQLDSNNQAGKIGSSSTSVQKKSVEKDIPSIDYASVQAATASINDFLRQINKQIQFEVDEESHQTIVKLVDKNTNEVLRQFPSKQMIEISKDLSRFQGILVSVKA